MADAAGILAALADMAGGYEQNQAAQNQELQKYALKWDWMQAETDLLRQRAEVLGAIDAKWHGIKDDRETENTIKEYRLRLGLNEDGSPREDWIKHNWNGTQGGKGEREKPDRLDAKGRLDLWKEAQIEAEKNQSLIDQNPERYKAKSQWFGPDIPGDAMPETDPSVLFQRRLQQINGIDDSSVRAQLEQRRQPGNKPQAGPQAGPAAPAAAAAPPPPASTMPAPPQAQRKPSTWELFMGAGTPKFYQEQQAKQQMQSAQQERLERLRQSGEINAIR